MKGGFLPDWTDHWVSGAADAAAAGGAALVTASGVSVVSELAFEVGFSGSGGGGESGADMIVWLTCCWNWNWYWRICGLEEGVSD